MPKRTKRSSFLKDIALITIVFCATVFGYQRFHSFNYQPILDSSVLKSKTFAAEVQEISTPQGISAYLLEDNTNPIISLSFIFKNAGSAYQSPSELGLSTVLCSVLLDGAGKYSSQKFKELLEENAITISYRTTLDDFMGELTYLKDKQTLAADLLKATLTAPHFSASDLSRTKEELLVAQKSQQENPGRYLNTLFSQEIYGTHPYARNPLGTPDTAKNITAKALKTYLQQNFSKQNLVIGIAGDITAPEAATLIDQIFATLPATQQATELPEATINFDGRQTLINRQIPQNITSFVSKGLCRNDPDFYPLYIANHILGGSQMQSRLFMLTRENEGLTYGAYSYLSMLDHSCTIKGGFATSAQNLPKMINIIKKQWQKMGQNGVTEAELTSAKNYLLASFNLRFTSISEIAQQLALMQRQNLGKDFLKNRNLLVQNVQLSDVNRVAKVYFNINDVTFVSIGQ